jgi:HSP20 family protein
MERMLDEFVSPQPLRRRVASLFEPLLGATRGLLGRGAEAVFVPDVELTERDDTYVLRVDLPGIRERDVNVNVDDDNVLTITGERRREEGKRERGYEYTEREYGSFTRSVQLPRGADVSKIEADFRNGVLEVHVPKGESMRARQIPIRSREAREIGRREEPRVLETGNGGR